MIGAILKILFIIILGFMSIGLLIDAKFNKENTKLERMDSIFFGLLYLPFFIITLLTYIIEVID